MPSAPSTASGRRRVLILTGDPIGPRLASHGIRVWNMAVELSGAHDVRLLTTSRAERTDPRFEVAAVAAGDSAAFAPLEAWADVIIVHGAGYIAFPALRRTSTPLVADAYGPMVLEHLEFDRHLPPEQAEPEVAHSAWIVNELLTRADYVLVASERQRLYVLGCLSALGRINPLTYGDDATLGELVGIVPFGLSPEPPRHDRPALRGVVPGIGADDTVLIWSGGIYNWFDPETLIRAVAEVAARHDDIRLFFLGTVHPSPEVPEMPVITASRRLAAELGVAGRHVFFNDAWVDFDDRQNYLLEADAGVSTHREQLETTLSFRTRMLDYLWAGLPMVVTEGDHFADLVDADGLGAVVPAGDVAALASAIEGVVYDGPARAAAAARVTEAARRYEWPTALAPLARFVADPHPAADRARGVTARFGRPRRRSAGERLVALLRGGGLRAVAAKVRARVAPRR